MGCIACAKKKANGYQDMKVIETPPYRATDIVTYDIESQTYRKFESSDWDTNVINVLAFVPSLQDIKEENYLGQEGVNVTYVTSQPIHQIDDYIKNNDLGLAAPTIFSSYLLVSRSGLMLNGSTKKALVYVMPDGDTAKQEFFHGSTFDYKAVRNFLEDYHNVSH